MHVITKMFPHAQMTKILLFFRCLDSVRLMELCEHIFHGNDQNIAVFVSLPEKVTS